MIKKDSTFSQELDGLIKTMLKFVPRENKEIFEAVRNLENKMEKMNPIIPREQKDNLEAKEEIKLISKEGSEK